MKEIILYTTHCPICIMLERKLQEKNIYYVENNDISEMKRLGISSVPILKVDDKLMTATEAMEFLNKL